MADLAKRLALSPRTMVRRFSEEIWLTPKEWLTERRIFRARHLLKSTDLTIADVCHATGYEDVPSFSRSFSKMTGTTPGAYRRQSRSFTEVEIPFGNVLRRFEAM
ncbi:MULTISPECIES: helix-turn-helix domain-containing protein [Agrobacterium]|uniref:helix-turn-helix domain-containing protein n=1 Tax=Agrobacterium TaxID=357 RepID=UPI00138AAE0C|nr:MULTISPECIES: helix-turn-helix transcriptional regulator [Agrobacterium]